MNLLQFIQKWPAKWRSPPMLILLGAFIIVFLLITMRPGAKPSETEERATRVHAVTLARGNFAPSITLYARVESPARARLKSPVTAYVLATPALEGKVFQKDEVLIKLDERDIRFTVDERSARVAQLKSQIESEKVRYRSDLDSLKHERKLVELAKNSVKRQQHLVKTNTGSQAELETAEQALRQQQLLVTQRKLAVDDHKHRLKNLEATLASNVAQLKQAQLDLSRASVRAPFKGRVTRLQVAVGDRVNAGDNLLDIFDSEHVELRAQIPSRFVSTVTAAMQAKLTLKANAQVHGVERRLVLDRLSGEVGQGRAGIDGLFKVVDSDAYFSLGKTVTLILTLPSQPDVYRIPSTALYGGNRVYKIVDERLQSVSVEMIGSQESAEGDAMILIQSKQLRDGDVVSASQIPQAVTGMRVEAVSKRK